MKKHCAVSLFVFFAGTSFALPTAFAGEQSGDPDSPKATQPKKESSTEKRAVRHPSPKDKVELDRSGKPRRGKASYYHHKFAGRKMADGTPMNPKANIAASRTLPLGTKAEVVNLENGKSAEVEIRDRGPYVDGRIVDLSPKVARELDIVDQGVASVEVRPIEVPQPDGSTMTASGASTSEKVASGQ